jgi:hypothetical protein
MILKAYKFKLKNKALALQLEMNILRAGQALSGDIGHHKAT